MLRIALSAALHLAIAAALAFHSPAARAYSWDRPHGSGTNAGFFDAATLPAKTPLKIVDNIGTFAPGTNPVIAADGTVYIGNQQGVLMAFRPDGTPWWKRDIAGQSILASPLLDAAGNIYVVGIKPFTDHRVNPARERFDAALHKFTASGGWIRDTPMPEKFGAGGTSDIIPAAPNMWKTGNAEVIMLPVVYDLPMYGGWETHLLAFSTETQLLADVTVGDETGSVTGGSGEDDLVVYSCLLPLYIHCEIIFSGAGGFGSSPTSGSTESVHQTVLRPVPTVATYVYPGGGTPHVLITDGFENLVDYTFGGMNFNEVFRIHSEEGFDNMEASPTVRYDGHTIFTDHAGIRFAGPNMTPLPTVKDVHTVTPPTILQDGRIAVVTTRAEVAIINSNGSLGTKIPLDDFTVASAAASHTHFYVSTWHHFISYDSSTLQEVARYDWTDGGLSSPVIGPQGNVYAIEGNKLYVFPGPGQATASTGVDPSMPAPSMPTVPASTDQGTGQPQQPTQSARQAYKPPLTANGNRLFACQSVDGDNCGKGDAKNIAQAFCQKQGFSAVDDIDTDNKKVKAETLDGQYCTKKRCKVFDKIVCKM